MLVAANAVWPSCDQAEVFVHALTLKELLLQLSLGDLNLDSLVDLLRMTAAVVGVVLDGGGEEGVDEGGLAQARLASDHDGESGTALRNNLVTLVGELHVVSTWRGASAYISDGTHVGNADRRHSFGHFDLSVESLRLVLMSFF
jgi:hypothetical protein